MKSSDIWMSILIIGLFIILLLFSLMSSNVNSIENNWEKHRCNPLVMPFVSLVGHNSSENFIKCIQSFQMYNMKKILEPIEYNMKIIGVIGERMTETISDINALINSLRLFISDIVKNIYRLILNLLIEIQRSLLSTKRVVVKMDYILSEIAKESSRAKV